MLSLLYLGVKAQQCFVTSSCMFLDEKTALETGPRAVEIHLNRGVNKINIVWRMYLYFNFKVIYFHFSVHAGQTAD